MAQITRRTSTTIRHEYLIPRPADRKEICLALAWILQDLKKAGKDASYDDAYHVDADDDNIILYWEETELG